MTLSKRLKEIKERCDAATEGPWLKRTRSYDGEEVLCYREVKVVAWNDTNLKFIAHARTDVPMLIEGWETTIRLIEEHGCFCRYKNDDPDDPSGLIYECMGHELQRFDKSSQSIWPLT